MSVLGPVQLRLDGESLPVRAGKTAELLVRLALDAGAMVRTDRLIEDLWGDEAFATQRNTLQATVSRLRRALGDAAVVTGSPSGYTLEIEASAVDALEAPRLAASASELLAAGDPTSALEVASGALTMFRGEILADAGDGDWVVPHRVQLEETRLRLKEHQLVARMDLGAAGEVVGELEALVALHPLRERLWALLITALYRDGRQADALAAYRRVREQMVDELGIDPGPELQALEQQVLLHDRLLDAPARDGADDATGVRGNLPTLSSALVGRERDVQEVLDQVAEHRLVTVIGPAGVGKTRVAIEAARGASGAGTSWLVRLEAAGSPAALIETVGASLQLHGATEAMVIHRLRAQDMLLVLDNCEHIVEAIADLVATFLDAAPRLRVLATSQLPLGLDGEALHVLEPLTVEDAVTLFAQRAAERRTSFVLDPEAAATVEELCRSLDGLPLAIELAAARTKVLSVQEIARRLDDRFTLLSDPTSRAPERRRALGAAISWSYDLLFPDEQRGLWALACFSGGSRLDAAEAVLEVVGVPHESAVDVVGRLADRSLVAVEQDAAGSTRYRLLESVRAFALERLAEAELTDVARGAHAAWFGEAAETAGRELRGPRQALHLELARVERANIDAALEWTGVHDPLIGMQIANGFGWGWLMQGDGVVGADRVRAALGAARAAEPSDRAIAYSLLGWLQAASDIDRAHTDALEAIAIADPLGDDRLSAIARISLGFVLSQLGPPSDLLDLLDEWRASYPSMHGTWEDGSAWILTAHGALFLGDVARARVACDGARRVIETLGDDWGTSQLEAVRGFLAQGEQRFDDAVLHLTRAAEAARRLGFSATESFHAANLGRVLQQVGDDQAAINTLERAIEMGQTTGELRITALARGRLGRVLRALGDRDGARVMLEAADGWYRALGPGGRALASRDGAALAACLFAAMDVEDGVPGAMDRLAILLQSARDAGDIEIEVLTLDALAMGYAQTGDAEEASRRLAAADALMPFVAYCVSDADRLDARAARALLA